MPKQKPEENGERVNFQLWLKGEAAERYIEVLRRAKQRQPRANNAHVNGRLLGLEPDLDGLVTEDDRAYFQSSGSAMIEVPVVNIGLGNPVTEKSRLKVNNDKGKCCKELSRSI